MRIEQVDPAYHVGFDRTSDVIAMLPENNDPWGPEVCELIGICTAVLLELGNRWGTDQAGALQTIKQLL